jgi:UDP-N-acetylmuramoyl-tripeptide--D-alanyl-D-alanine ligase
MGMRGMGQIARLAAVAEPSIGVITNVGPVHLELVERIENVARAKAELIEALPPGGVAVVPDEPLLEPYLRDDIEVRRFAAEVPFDTSYTARHQLDNTRAAVAVCEVLGVPLPSRLDVAFTPLREEEHELANGVLLLNDCYNANPVSMHAALEHLAERAGTRRRVAVLGDMAELGPGAPAFHREVGRQAAELGVEVIGVGPLARDYGGRSLDTAAAAADAVAALVRPGDVVLVKGSRSVGLEAVAAKLLD